METATSTNYNHDIRRYMPDSLLRRSLFGVHSLGLCILPSIISQPLRIFGALREFLTRATRTLVQSRPSSGLCCL